MKNKIKGKLFRLQHRTFNTTDVFKIESEVIYRDIPNLENPLLPCDKEIAAMGITITLKDESKEFVRYSSDEFKQFESEAIKAYRKIKDYQNKIKMKKIN